jgi:hypothetical protein
VAQMSCSKAGHPVLECAVGMRLSPYVTNTYRKFFWQSSFVWKINFITAPHSSEVKSRSLRVILTSYVQQSVQYQATIMKFRSGIFKTLSFDTIKV